jgi:predicted nucleotidyltransferase
VVDRLLGATEIKEALRRLALRLERRRLVGEICVYEGAAMILAYDSRRVTRDVDALVSPHGPVLDEAREMGLPDGWLNESVSLYVSRVPDADQPSVYDHPNLRVRSVSARHLVAMKAIAARRVAEDRADLATLIVRLGLSEPAEVERIVAEVFPDEPLTDHSRAVIAEAFALASGRDGDAGGG